MLKFMETLFVELLSRTPVCLRIYGFQGAKSIGWKESSLDKTLQSIQSHQVNISRSTLGYQKDHKVFEMSIAWKVRTANVGSK